MRKLTGFVFAAVVMCFSLTATADEGSTMRAVRVETSDVGAYVEQLKEGKRLIQNIDEKFTLSVWQATYAGDSTGTIIVAIIYPGSYATFAAAWEKLTADPAVNAWLAGLSELRAIVSDSIFMEHPL